MDASVSAEKMMVMAQPLMMFLMFGTILTITYISSKLILRGEMEIGKFSTLYDLCYDDTYVCHNDSHDIGTVCYVESRRSTYSRGH